MIIKPFENKYDKQIYNCLKEPGCYTDLSEGDKAILYDLMHDIKKIVKFDWSEINIPVFVQSCYFGYKKHKHAKVIQVLANCINSCFPDKTARIIKTDNGNKIEVISKRKGGEIE